MTVREQDVESGAADAPRAGAPTAPGRPRLLGPDPLLPLVCLVSAAAYLLPGLDGYLTRDLGLYSYGGQQVAEGSLPYEAVVNRAGPLAHAVPALGVAGARLLGLDDVTGMRALFLLLSVACIGVLYVLGRDLFRSRLAGIASAAVLLSLTGFTQYAVNGPREKTTMVLLLLLALLALVHRRWAAVGVFISLATLTWQPVFFAAAAGAVTTILLTTRTGRLAALTRVAVGGLVPLLVTVLGYAVNGSLGIFWESFFLVNAAYTEQTSLLGEPGYAWLLLVEGYGVSVWAFVLGSIFLLALTVHTLTSPEDRQAPAGAVIVGLGVLHVVGVLWSLKAFNGWPDNFFMLPGAALGVGGAVLRLQRHAPGRTATSATLAWVVAAAALAAGYSPEDRYASLTTQQRAVAAVTGALPSGFTMLAVEAPQPLVLARQRNVSRFQLYGNGLVDYVDSTWPGGLSGYADWLAAQRPTVVAVGEGEMPDWLVPMLDRDYQWVGDAPGWAWYVRTDLGADSLAALRRAAGSSGPDDRY